MPSKNSVRTRQFQDLTTATGIIKSDHQRGADELVFRHFKDVRDQRLPFRNMFRNMAFYYIMLISYKLFRCFMKGPLQGVVDAWVYAYTVRRQVFDIAAKLVRHAGRVVPKVSRCSFKRLGLVNIWSWLCRGHSLRAAT